MEKAILCISILLNCLFFVMIVIPYGLTLVNKWTESSLKKDEAKKRVQLLEEKEKLLRVQYEEWVQGVREKSDISKKR